MPKTEIPSHKAIPGKTFSLIHPSRRDVVTGVGEVVEVEEKRYPVAKVIFKLISGIFIPPTDVYINRKKG